MKTILISMIITFCNNNFKDIDQSKRCSDRMHECVVVNLKPDWSNLQERFDYCAFRLYENYVDNFCGRNYPKVKSCRNELLNCALSENRLDWCVEIL